MSKKLLACIGLSIVFLGTVSGTDAMTPVPDHQIGGIKIRIFNGMLANNKDLRENLRAFMLAADIADGIYREHKEKGVGMKRLRSREQMKQMRMHLQKFIQALMSTGQGSTIRAMLRDLISKHRVANISGSSALLPQFVSDDPATGNQKFHGAFDDDMQVVSVLEQIRVLRDVLIDNMSSSARKAFINDFGESLMNRRFIPLPQGGTTYIGWTNKQMLAGLLLAALAGGVAGRMSKR